MIFKEGTKITGYFLEKGAWDGGRHTGLDMVPISGSKDIHSLTNGTVVDMDCNNVTGLGNYVAVWDNLNKALFRYAHLDSVSIRIGQKINRGDKLGVMGGTAGNKTYPEHLHLDYFPTNRKGARSSVCDWKYIRNDRGNEDPEPIVKLIYELTGNKIVG